MDRRSVTLSLLSAALGGLLGAGLVTVSAPKPELVKDVQLQEQVNGLMAQAGRLAAQVSGLQVQLADLQAVNRRLDSLETLTGQLSVKVSQTGVSSYFMRVSGDKVTAPLFCSGKPAVWSYLGSLSC